MDRSLPWFLWNLEDCKPGKGKYFWASSRRGTYLAQPCPRDLYMTESFPKEEEEKQDQGQKTQKGWQTWLWARKGWWVAQVQGWGRRQGEKVGLHAREERWRKGRRQSRQVEPQDITQPLLHSTEESRGLWTRKTQSFVVQGLVAQWTG